MSWDAFLSLSTLLTLVPLDAAPVRPVRGQGFAATIIVAFVVMGVLALTMIFVSSKPKNRWRRRP